MFVNGGFTGQGLDWLRDTKHTRHAPRHLKMADDSAAMLFAEEKGVSGSQMAMSKDIWNVCFNKRIVVAVKNVFYSCMQGLKAVVCSLGHRPRCLLVWWPALSRP